MRFRDLTDFAMAYGWQRELGTYAPFRGTFLVHAATDDDIVHLARFTVNTPTDMVLFFDCSKRLVDGTLALPYLRGDDDEVSCMSCVARTAA